MYRLNRLSIVGSLALAAFIATGHLQAAPVISTNLAPFEGVTNDLFDVSQGTVAYRFSPLHQNAAGAGSYSAASSLLGATSSYVEPTHVLFRDNTGAGTVDSISFFTPTAVNLSSYTLRAFDDNSGTVRSASNFTLFASPDGLTFSPISSASPSTPYSSNPGVSGQAIQITDTFATPQYGQFFRLEVTQADNNASPRLVELDGFGTQTTPVLGPKLAPLAFDAASNLSPRDFPAGLATNIVASSALTGPGIGTPDITTVFGRRDNTAFVEPNSYLFKDAANSVGTLDTITWHTTSPIDLAGYRVGLGGEGAANGNNRGAGIVNFYANGVLVDSFDAGGSGGLVTRLLSGGFLADNFKIEFTRLSTSGVRVTSLEAITVPEPSSIVLAGLAAALGVVGARRQRRDAPRA